MFRLVVIIADRQSQSGIYLRNRNASDSSDHVVKIADRLGCLRRCNHIDHKNSRRRKIVKISDSFDSQDKWETCFSLIGNMVTIRGTEYKIQVLLIKLNTDEILSILQRVETH